MCVPSEVGNKKQTTQYCEPGLDLNNVVLFLLVSVVLVLVLVPLGMAQPLVVREVVARNIFEHTCHRFWTPLHDSRHVLWSRDTAFDMESDVQVKSKQFRGPGAKHEEKLPQKSGLLKHSFFFVLWRVLRWRGRQGRIVQQRIRIRSSTLRPGRSTGSPTEKLTA